MGSPELLLLVVVVIAGYLVQTSMGFGSMILCVTLGAQLMPITRVVTLLVPVSLFQTAYIVLRHRRGVRWRLLLLEVLPLMGIGLLAGLLLAARVSPAWLKMAFGALVLVLAVRELWVRLRAGAGVVRPLPRPLHVVALIAAGVVHGIYATGGPLLVYALGRQGIGKYDFRSTVTAVWLVLNVVLSAQFVVSGRLVAADLPSVGLLLLGVPIGVVLGEWVHERVDERRFMIAVFGLLVLAALTLLLGR